MNADELVALARQAQQSDAPYRELAELLLRVREADNAGTDARAVERILAGAPYLARDQAWAADMQLGAEGFDNTGHANAYREVRACLVAAGGQLARACDVLLSPR